MSTALRAPQDDHPPRCRANMALIRQSRLDSGLVFQVKVSDRLRVGWLNGSFIHWEGCRESSRCARDTYPESYISKQGHLSRVIYFQARIRVYEDYTFHAVPSSLGSGHGNA